ncbi:hypothetical protein GCM10010350_77520 [Streptomyces galilaeus]|nr:hypothetical protein GCM10010350_77520 [Streptomyces galilaeus]
MSFVAVPHGAGAGGDERADSGGESEDDRDPPGCVGQGRACGGEAGERLGSVEAFTFGSWRCEWGAGRRSPLRLRDRAGGSGGGAGCGRHGGGGPWRWVVDTEWP